MLWKAPGPTLNILVVAGSGKLLSTIMPEGSPGLILEVPPYRLPKCRVVLSKT
jgi:Fe2+ transport system protein B